MTGKKNSINYIVAVKEKEKQWTLIEYKLKWTKDYDEDDEMPENPEVQLLGDSKLYGADIEEMDLLIKDKTTVGVWITTTEGKFLLKSEDNLKFEFKDRATKSTIQKITTTKEKELFISICRFTKKMIVEFRDQDIKVRDQFMLSQLTHETQLNVLVQEVPLLKYWLFTEYSPNIFQP